MTSGVWGGDRRRWALALAGVVALGLVTRGAVVAPLFVRASVRPDDPDNYLPLARSVAAGSGFCLNGRPTAYRPPLYPLLLAPLVGSADPAASARRVALLHVGLGGLTVLLTARAARRFGMSDTRSLVAAALVACDPVLVAQSRPVMTETLAACLTAATLAAVGLPGRLGWLAGGAVCGLAALCRPSAWPGTLLSAAFLAVAPGSWRERLTRTAFFVLAAAGVVAPWAWRNARVFGEPIVTTTHGGYTLFLANNPVYYDEVVNGPAGRVWSGDRQWHWWDSVNRATRGMPEPDADRWARRQAVATILERPVDFMKATAARLGRFWGLSPAGAVYPRGLRLATALWTLPFWAALALGLLFGGNGSWPRASATAALLGLTAVHAFYWTDMRMRAAAVPAAAVVAASAARPGGRPDREKTGKIPGICAVQISDRR